MAQSNSGQPEIDSRIPGWAWAPGSATRVLTEAPPSAARRPRSPSRLPRYAAAANIDTPALDLVGQIVAGEDCLIVTGYGDFLSTLSIVMEKLPGIAQAPPDTVRILFGEEAAERGPRRMALAEEARRHFLESPGLGLKEPEDILALRAHAAIRSNAIRVRVFDRAAAARELGTDPGPLTARLFSCEQFAALGGSGLSRRRLSEGVDIFERCLHGSDAYRAREQYARRFWGWGASWKKEALDVLETLVARLSPQEAVRRTLDALESFAPWRDAAGGDGLLFDALATLHEHGFVAIEETPGRDTGPASPLAARLAPAIDTLHQASVWRGPEGRRLRAGAAPAAVGHAPSRRAPPEGAADGVAAAGRVVCDAHRAGSGAAGGAAAARHRGPDGSWTACLATMLPEADAAPALCAMTRAVAGPAAAEALRLGLEGEAGESSGAAGEAPDAVLAALAPMLLRRPADAEEGQAGRPLPVGASRDDIDRHTVALTSAQTRAVADIVAILDEMRGGDAETGLAAEGPVPDARAAIAGRLLAAMRDSFEAAQYFWKHGGLAREMKALEAGAGPDRSGQASLPMFDMLAMEAGDGAAAETGGAAGGEAPARTQAERIEAALAGRTLRGADQRRMKAVREAVETRAPAVVLTDTDEAAVIAAQRLAEAADIAAAAAVPEPRHREVLRGVGARSAGCTSLADAAAARDWLGAGSGGEVRVLVLSHARAGGMDLSAARSVLVLGTGAAPGEMIQALNAIAGAGAESQDRQTGQQTGQPAGAGRAPLSVGVAEIRALAFSASAAAREAAASDYRTGRFGTAAGQLDPADILRHVLAMRGSGRPLRRANLPEARRLLRDAMAKTADPQGGAPAAGGPRDADARRAAIPGMAVLEAEIPFTLIAFRGTAGGMGGAYAPPRLAAIVPEAASEGAGAPAQNGRRVVLRSQVACLDLLARALDAGGADMRPASGTGEGGPESWAMDAAMAGDAACITDWDLRPERSVAPLAAAADLIAGVAAARATPDAARPEGASGAGPSSGDMGAALLGDLSLGALEYLAALTELRLAASAGTAGERAETPGALVAALRVARPREADALSEELAGQVAQMRAGGAAGNRGMERVATVICGVVPEGRI